MSHPGNDFINDLIADGEEHEEPDLRSDDYEVDLMYEDAMHEARMIDEHIPFEDTEAFNRGWLEECEPDDN